MYNTSTSNKLWNIMEYKLQTKCIVKLHITVKSDLGDISHITIHPHLPNKKNSHIIKLYRKHVNKLPVAI